MFKKTLSLSSTIAALGVALMGCSSPSVQEGAALDQDYLKPAASVVTRDGLSQQSFREASRVCGRSGGTRGFGIAGSRVASALITGVAVKLADIAADKAAEQLAGYFVRDTFETELTFRSGTNCLRIEQAGKAVLLLQSRVFRTRSGETYGLKLRPLWFDPASFDPPEDGRGDDPQMAVAMAVTPAYFVDHERLVGRTQQVLAATFPEAEAQSGGFSITGQSSSSWDAWPLLAGPPTGQISVLKVEVASAVKPPAALVFVADQLAKNGDRLGQQAADAILK